MMRVYNIYDFLLRMFFLSLGAILILPSCKKLVEIPEPVTSIVTSRIFSSDITATQAMTGVYYIMVNYLEPSLTSGGMTIYTGYSSDELIPYNQTYADPMQFYQNALTPINNQLPRLWRSPFSIMYQANALLDGLERSTAISDSVKKELMAEAKFVRAFLNFNLVNLFGDIPIVTSINWRETNMLARQPLATVYQAIIADLRDAQAALPQDYSVARGARIVPNKWAATALLARVHLYLGDWTTAEAEATSVINAGLYSLEPVLNDVFKPNSKEAIWQMQQDNTVRTATTEGWNLVPTFVPYSCLTPQLLNAFETGDKRKSSWVNSKIVRGDTCYYPYKYKIGILQSVPNGSLTEFYMVLRVAEQYLVRAEARAKQNRVSEATDDLNTIRSRAGLSKITALSMSNQQVLDAIAQERRIELFTEWGHRWLDLKRTGRADEVLSSVKGSGWKSSAKLYPIPYSDMLIGPNMKQNPGYY